MENGIGDGWQRQAEVEDLAFYASTVYVLAYLVYEYTCAFNFYIIALLQFFV